MKQQAKIFDSISGYLFLMGSITAKLKIIPSFMASAIFNLVSLFAYLIGYVAWYVASSLYPDHPRHQDSWYGFAQFKAQYQMAALLGTIATITTIMCIIIPSLTIPTAWLYTLSNLIWSISEYHKQKNPPDDPEYSNTKQALYVRYTVTITLFSALTSMSTTLAILFPPAGFAVITTAALIGVGLTIASFYYWGNYTFGNHSPDTVNHSYDKLSEQLSFNLNHQLTPTNTINVPTSTQKSPPATPTAIKHLIDEDNFNSLIPLLATKIEYEYSLPSAAFTYGV